MQARMAALPQPAMQASRLEYAELTQAHISSKLPTFHAATQTVREREKTLLHMEQWSLAQ